MKYFSLFCRLCPIFRLGDIVRHANGNITKLATTGGVIGIGEWECIPYSGFFYFCLPTDAFEVFMSVSSFWFLT